MGAVFSYSLADLALLTPNAMFQSLMGAVFSYSGHIRHVGFHIQAVSIPDGCSVQL